MIAFCQYAIFAIAVRVLMEEATKQGGIALKED